MRLALATSAAFVACVAQASPCASLPAELKSMVAADQALRRELTESDRSSAGFQRLFDRVQLIDRTNTRRLRQLLARCGWPRRTVHGDEAVGNAWLLVQHADHEPRFQESVVALLEAAVRNGEASGVQLAYLSDRVATAQGKPQRYGTQFKLEGPCGLELLPIDDAAKVEQRRRQLGMPSMAEYRDQVARHALPAACAAGKE